MNRDVNKGIEINKQKDVLPVVSMIGSDSKSFVDVLARVSGCNSEDIVGTDLYLYPFEKGCITGIDSDFISSPRLDDQAMVFAALEAMTESECTTGVNVLACFDNEEVGSSTKQGANSVLIERILEKMDLALGLSREDFMINVEKSMLVSADMAHALHPNYVEKNDPVLKPLLNGGPVIKFNANQRYTTDGETSAIFRILCRRAGVPCQEFCNRSDMPCGSTIGPMLSSKLSMKSVDVGSPMLSMHSCVELTGIRDDYYMIKVFKEFYRS